MEAHASGGLPRGMRRDTLVKPGHRKHFVIESLSLGIAIVTPVVLFRRFYRAWNHIFRIGYHRKYSGSPTLEA